MGKKSKNDKPKNTNSLDGLQDNIQNLLGDIQQMDNQSFMKLLEEEKKKLFELKKENPNNPLFNMLNDDEIDISQEDFIETCQTLMNGDVTENISKLFMGDNQMSQVDNKPEGDEITEETTENNNEDDDNQAPDG